MTLKKLFCILAFCSNRLKMFRFPFTFYTFFIKALLLLVGLSACVHSSVKNSLSAEQLFKQAQNYQSKKQYSKTLEVLSQLEKNYAFNSYNQEASLLRADIYFAKKQYLEACSQYKNFQKLYAYKKIHYIHYQLGLCHFFQMPPHHDRDLLKGNLALEYFYTLNKKNNPYQKQAQQYIYKIAELKGKKEFHTALFYKKKQWKKAALKKMQNFLKKFPNHSHQPEALLYAYQWTKKSQPSLASSFKNKLLKKFPKSKEAQSL